MKIGIDMRPLVLGASGGITQLVKGICEHMFALYPEHHFLVFVTPFNRSLLEFSGENVTYHTLPLPTFFYQIDQIAIEQEMDVLFRSYPMEDTLNFPRYRQIYLIPDIQHEHYPEFFTEETIRTRRVAFANALGEAGAVGTISEFAKQTLLEFHETRCKDIFLMEPALQDAHQGTTENELSSIEKSVIPQGQYFIFPANLWQHKNHENLLRAFQLFIESTKNDVQLILTGHQKGWPELAEKFPDLPVIHLGFVNPALLRVLLEKSQALVFFSLYEGFGIPLLEAFDAGVPVICSNTTSLPEVGGDAVLSCDPLDVEAIANLMDRILTDQELRCDLLKKGKLRLQAYSWDQSARNLVAACARVSKRAQDWTSTQVETVPDSDATALVSQDRFPLVSIVTPSYNQGRFLKRTIDSVLTQGYPNLEYVVFDGGSTDESVEILKSYDNGFFWVSEPDKGQTDAINKGMALAKGEILAYLNSDDVLLPDTINKVVRFFEQNPDCDLVYGDAFYIDEDDHIIGNYKTADYSLNRLIEDCMICQPATFWRRSVVEKIGLFNADLNYAMDYDYWLRLASQGGQICHLPEPLACSRLYPETKTKSARSKIYKEIFDICRQNVGCIHESYFQGYWHHLLYEKNSWLSKRLQNSPELYKKFAKIHLRWSNYRHNPQRLNPSFVYQKFSTYTKRLVNTGREHLGAYEGNGQGDSSGRVKGYWFDSWLAPVLTVEPREKRVGQQFYLAGFVPQEVEVTVHSGDEIVLQTLLVPYQYQTILLPIDLDHSKPIRIEFSNYTKDAASRQIAFLLQDTNLFAEQDLY